MDKEVKTPTLCWTCRNALPKIVNGKYICGCSWSVHLRPVKGWTAEKSIKNANSANKIEMLLKEIELELERIYAAMVRSNQFNLYCGGFTMPVGGA